MKLQATTTNCSSGERKKPCDVHPPIFSLVAKRRDTYSYKNHSSAIITFQKRIGASPSRNTTPFPGPPPIAVTNEGGEECCRLKPTPP